MIFIWGIVWPALGRLFVGIHDDDGDVQCSPCGNVQDRSERRQEV